MAEELKKIEILTANSRDEYTGEAARKIDSALDHAGQRAASRTTPVEIYPNETIEFNYEAVIRITRFYGLIQEPEEDNPYNENDEDYKRIDTLKGV